MPDTVGATTLNKLKPDDVGKKNKQQSNVPLLLSVDDDAAVLSCKLSVVDVLPNFQPKTQTLEGISDNQAKRELLATPEIQGTHHEASTFDAWEKNP